MPVSESPREAEWIEAARGGDREAFGRLVEAKREWVVRVAYQVTGDWDDALDVAQGVFLRLWKSLDRYDSARRFDTWLYRVVSNAAIDHLRSRGPKGQLQPLPEDPADLVPAGDGRPPPPSPEERLDADELQRAFLRLAAGLAPQQRTAFVLREIEGQSTAEVARIMNVAESTVRNHLFQARKVLRAGLERDYADLLPTRERGDHR